MPRLIESAITKTDSNVSTVAVKLPPHQIDDLLLIFVCKDSTSGSDLSASAGWTEQAFADNTSAGISGAIFWRIATETSTPDPFISSTDPDTWIAVSRVWRGVNTSNPINVFDSATFNSIDNDPVAPTLVTTLDNCAIEHGVFCDNTRSPTPLPGLQDIFAEDGEAISMGMGWRFAKSSGAQGGHQFYLSALEDFITFSLAIEDDGNAVNPPYVDNIENVSEILTPVQGSSTNNSFGGSFSTTLLTTYVPDIEGVGTVVGNNLSIADQGVNPYHQALRLTQAAGQQPGGPGVEFAGAMYQFASAQDLDGVNVVTHIRCSGDRELQEIEPVETRGFVIVFISDSGAGRRAWQVSASDSDPNHQRGLMVTIDPGDSSSALETQGTYAPDNITHIAWFVHRNNGTTNHYISQVHKAIGIEATGGSTELPLNGKLYQAACKGSFNEIVTRPRTGALAPFYIVSEVTIGDETNPCISDFFGQLLEFPATASETDKRLHFHGDPLSVGIELKTTASCEVGLRSCIVSGQDTGYFRVSAGSVNPSELNVSGLSLNSLREISLRDIGTWEGFAATDSREVQAQGCSLTGVTIREHNPASPSGIAINASSSLSSSSFLGNDCAIRIVEQGTYNFNNLTFTGNTFNVCIDASVNADNVTINILGGTSFGLPQVDVQGSGTPTILNPTSIDIRVQDESQVAIENSFVYIDEDDVAPRILDEITDVNGEISGTYNGATITGVLRVRKYGFRPIKNSIELGSGNINQIVTMAVDPQQA